MTILPTSSSTSSKATSIKGNSVGSGDGGGGFSVRPSSFNKIKNRKKILLTNTVMFLIGSFLGYISWIVGVLFLLQALRSGIRYILYRNQWITTINYIGSSSKSKTYKGQIIEAIKTIHPITNDISYSVSFEYEYDTNNNNYNFEDEDENDNNFNNTKSSSKNTKKTPTKKIKKKLTSYQEAKWLYEKYQLLKQQQQQQQQQQQPTNDDNNDNNYYDKTTTTTGIFIDVKVMTTADDDDDQKNPNNNNSSSSFALSSSSLSGIPSDIFYYKLTCCKFWSQIVDPIIAFVGIHIYAFGCITYSWMITTTTTTVQYNNNNNFNNSNMYYWILLGLSLVVAPILMVPFLLREQGMVHKQRMWKLQTNPSLLDSELESIQKLLFDKLGFTSMKKSSYAISFVVGILELVWMTGIVVGIIAIISVSTYALLITDGIQSKREHLERYNNHNKSQTVYNGKVTDHHRHILVSSNNNNNNKNKNNKFGGGGGGRYEVTIQYEMTSKGKNENDDDDDDVEEEIMEGGSSIPSVTVITVEKQYTVSKQLYQTLLTTNNNNNNNNNNDDDVVVVPIRVLNGYPCSGIPVDKLDHDIINSWTTPMLHCLFWFTFLCYFVGCYWIVLDSILYEIDLYWDMADLIYYAILFLIGPILMIPQISTYHRIRYQKLIDETVFAGKIIHKRTIKATTTTRTQ